MPSKQKILDFIKSSKVTEPETEPEPEAESQFEIKNDAAKVQNSDAETSAMLFKAIIENKMEIATNLIDTGIPVDQRDDSGWTPLVWASAYGKRNLAQLLLDKGADITARTQSGWTALHWASAYGCVELAALLILKGADPAVFSEDGRTPIEIARSYGKLEMSRYLEEYLDIIKLPIHRAVWERADAKALKTRLKNFPGGVRQKDQKGNLPLHYAVETRAAVEMVVKLLAAYPDAAREKDNKGNFILHRAIELDSPSTVIVALLSSWQDAAKYPYANGRLPIFKAIELRMAPDIIKVLAEAHPEGTLARDGTGKLPIHVSLQGSQMFDTARILIAVNPAMAKERDAKGLLPLTRALELRAPVELVKDILRAYPPAAHERGKDGQHALHRALELHYPADFLSELLSAYPSGAKESNRSGQLPLHRALETLAPVTVIEELVKMFPKALRMKTKDGNLPTNIALEKPSPLPLMQILLNADPSLAGLKDRSGVLPLTRALQRSDVQPELVRLVLNAFPKAVAEVGRDGSLPFHRALDLALPVDLILEILQAFPMAASQPNKFGVLPLHSAIDNILHKDIISALVQGYPEAAWVRDMNGQLPIQKSMDSTETESYVSILLQYNLPVDRKTGLPVHDPDCIWTQMLQTTPPDKYLHAVEATLELVSDLVDDLAGALDKHGRKALDIATPKCKQLIQTHLHFYGRYELKPGPAEHQSATCIVRLAVDYSDQHRPVALKLMRNRDQFLRELSIRTMGGLSEDYVIGIIRHHDGDEDEKFLAETKRKKGYDGYRYCLVMSAADRNLAAVLSHEHIAGKDWESIKTIARQITHCLGYMHSKELIHGDIKPLNIMRQAANVKLIDLDASASFKADNQQYSGAKFSSAYIPPELLYQPIGIGSAAAVKVVILDEQGKPVFNLMPYDPVPAAPSHDMWALGVVLFQMCTGETLFHTNDEDNMDEESLLQLFEWSDGFKGKKLSKVSNPDARNLIAQLLSRDPKRRPSAERVLSHPFLSGKKVARMLGEKAAYDVFVSYRVFSDSNHVEELYNRLTAQGIRVWWDKKCLLPGEDWEDGFCDGLVKSRIFVCLLSREAIKNFSSLESTSRVDNVLLEHVLALELKKIGLLENVYPVLVGDRLSDGKYSSYFKSGCHPKVADVCVESVMTKVAEHLERQGLGTPLDGEATALHVNKELMNYQGGFVQDDYALSMDGISQTVYSMVSKLRQQDLRQTVLSSRPGTAAPSPQATPRGAGGNNMRLKLSVLESQNEEKDARIAELAKELSSQEALIEELRHHVTRLTTVARSHSVSVEMVMKIDSEEEQLETFTKSVLGENYVPESAATALAVEGFRGASSSSHDLLLGQIDELHAEIRGHIDEKQRMTEELAKLNAELEGLKSLMSFYVGC